MPHPSDSRQPGILAWEALLAAYVLGALAFRFPLPALAAAGLFALFIRGRSGLVTALIPLCLAAGYFHVAWRMPVAPTEHPGFIESREKALVSGRVAEVSGRPGNRLQILLEDVGYRLDSGGKGELPGRLLWTWDLPAAKPSPGDLAEFRTLVKPVRGFSNPGVWDYDFFRARQAVFYRTYTRGAAEADISRRAGPLAGLRLAFSRAIERNTPDDQGGALLQALLLGDRFRLQRGTVDLFRKAALSHSLALSGVHLGFICAIGFMMARLAGLFRPGLYLVLPRPKLAIALAAPLALFYVWLGGASPSLVRSAAMFASWGVMLMLSRPRVLMDGLFAALAAILLVSPLSVYDLRLQFSALAVAGIVLFFPSAWAVIGRFEPRDDPEGTAGQRGLKRAARKTLFSVFRYGTACLAVSFFANLALLPLVVWNFGTVSPNLLPNLLWLPVMGFAVLPLGLAGMLLASLPYGEPAGALLLHAASGLNSTVIGMLGKVGSLGLLFEGVALRPDWTGILGYYLLLGGAAYALGKGLGSRKGRVAGAAFLGAVLVLAQPLARELPVKARALSLLLLDTGQSQSILIESPRGKRVLVDGGGTWSTSFDIGRAVTSPVVTWKHPPNLDLMVMSHPDYDHSRGLVFPLRHFQVAAFAGNGRWPGGGSGAALREALAASRAEVQVWKAGMTRELEAGLHIETLHPPAGYNPDEDNDASLVLRLVWRGRGMALIPGDVEAPGLERLLASERELSARLLVLPHHGSSGSLSGEFYDRVAPRTAAACAGYMNYLGFPQPEVRRELARRSVPLHVTGERGALGFTWSSPDSFAVIESRLP